MPVGAVHGRPTNVPASAVLTGVPAAAAIALSSYIAVLFLVLVTRLYAAYVDAVRPRDQLNGLVTSGAERT